MIKKVHGKRFKLFPSCFFLVTYSLACPSRTGLLAQKEEVCVFTHQLFHGIIVLYEETNLRIGDMSKIWYK